MAHVSVLAAGHADVKAKLSHLMHDGLGEEIVELSVVTALRGRGTDLEQHVSSSTAHGLIGHSHCGQYTRCFIGDGRD
jgi:hypothetical protein